MSSASKKEWAEVEKLADPSKNMKHYRDKLSVSTSPMVPFLRKNSLILAIYLKDLTFINDGNPSKINGLINIDKLRMMAERVLEIVALAEKPFPYESVPTILSYVSKPPVEMDQNKLKAIAAQLEADGK